ncbi:MAG: glycoside hydrolase family 2 [Muribaculaceae bacterium]|nr:glycoside hydrolase family 2 [Muribaculaceae bacterium]
MTHKYFIALLTLIFAAACGAARTTTLLNHGWTFSKAGGTWESVGIPHSWNATDGTTPDYYRGEGIYRCRFDAPPAARQGQRTFVRFEAVSQDATVWLNGKRLGRHRGAFTAFSFEITSLLKRTANELVVQVTNAADSLIMPLEGDFTIFGGIYRPVTLLTMPAVCFTPQDYASCGIYVSQTSVSNDHAHLNITAKVDGATDQDYTLRTSVTAPDGGIVANQRITSTGRDGVFLTLNQDIDIDHPELWDGINHPAQHRFFFELMRGDQVIDTLSQLVGLRYYTVDAHKGFFLNGKSFPLRGVNRHQDRDGMGWAITHREHVEDMEIIKEIGAYCIRLAHYPHAEEFYTLCDEAGMLVWAEIPYIGHGTRHYAFDANARQQLTELIRQNYNHCSIFCWSLFNELGGSKRPHELVAVLNDLAHSEDPTRLTVAAANNAGRPENDMTDIMAYNTYPGWYWADPATMQWAIDWKYDPKKDRAIGISEYGAGGSIHQHDQHIDKAPKTDGNWHPEQWQATVHEGNYREIDKRPYVWGSFVWNMFDFASASRHEGDRMGINDKGLVTYDRRTRKDAFYFYQANWSKSPMVHITSSRHTRRTEAVTDVKVYSNCPGVTITVNGVHAEVDNKGMGIFVAHGVQLRPGENHITATGITSGKATPVTDQCTWILNQQ